MTQKTIMIGLVALAFVAGSIMTGTMAEAKEKPNGQPFQAIWNAIGLLQDQIDDVDTDSLQDQIDELKETQILGFYTVVGDDEGHTLGARISCDPGDVVVGGGGMLTFSGGQIRGTFPVDEDTWRLTVFGDDFGAEVQDARARCADYAPAHSDQGPIVVIP